MLNENNVKGLQEILNVARENYRNSCEKCEKMVKELDQKLLDEHNYQFMLLKEIEMLQREIIKALND